MELTNTIASSYLKDHFYTIYPEEELTDIADADLIIIGVNHDDIRFQEIYQSFINLFPAALVLIENEEKGKLAKHKECEMSWSIHRDITVKGWNDANHIQTFKKMCPYTFELSKTQNRNLYYEKVKKNPSKNRTYSSQEIIFLSRKINSEFNLKGALSARDYVQCQNSMLEAIQEGLQQNRTVIHIGGYVHAKISPNGYKHPKLESYIQEQLQTPSEYEKPFVNKVPLADKNLPENCQEPQWRQKFHEMFGNKKVVLLYDKLAIVDLASTDKTIDYLTYLLENKNI